jgi:hypothetical protein
VWVNRWCVGSLCLDLDMSEPRVKHATWSMQLTYLMQRLMYGRRGFVAGCGVIVLSQGSVTRCLAMGQCAHGRRHLMVNLSRSCESHEYQEDGRRLTGIRRDPGPHGLWFCERNVCICFRRAAPLARPVTLWPLRPRKFEAITGL